MVSYSDCYSYCRPTAFYIHCRALSWGDFCFNTYLGHPVKFVTDGGRVKIKLQTNDNRVSISNKMNKLVLNFRGGTTVIQIRTKMPRQGYTIIVRRPTPGMLCPYSNSLFELLTKMPRQGYTIIVRRPSGYAAPLF